MAAEADVIVGGAIPTEWPPVPRLRLFQIPWTGHEFTSPERMPAGVPVANTYEHETTIAEYVLAGMLEWQIGLGAMDAGFRAHGWGGQRPGDGPTHRELFGATLGIFGYGHIGREVALRARAFGMRTLGIRRSAAPCPPELDWLGRPGDLDEMLGQSDFVLIAADMNEATRGLFDAGRLAAMKPTGVLINVARGQIVDEDALWDALSNRRIGGAILDVWYSYNEPGKPEVRPARHAFETLENTILTPHRSALSEEMHARRWRFVAENCARIGRGEPPLNVVFVGTGGTGG
jgi:phosphoglycerate dehydrogenase-like enzyme